MASALATTGVLLSSCGDDLLSPSSAQGVSWRLASFQRKDFSVVNPADPSRFTLRLDPNNALSARADCNVCGGNYALSGSEMSVSPLACTRAYCFETAPLDTEYAVALQRARSLESREDVLTLFSDDGTLRFVR